jgi:hypothetical protein
VSYCIELLHCSDPHRVLRTKAPCISAHQDGVLAGWYHGQVTWRHAVP